MLFWLFVDSIIINKCSSLMSFRDITEEGLVKAKKDTLRMMLDQRPIIHKNVVAVSSINEQVNTI